MLIQLVLDIRGIDIRGFEYWRHPFHYPVAAREPFLLAQWNFLSYYPSIVMVLGLSHISQLDSVLKIIFSGNTYK